MSRPVAVSAEDVREAQAAIASRACEQPVKRPSKYPVFAVAAVVAALLLFGNFDAHKRSAMSDAGFHLVVGSALWLAGTAIVIVILGGVMWLSRKSRTDDPYGKPMTARLTADGIALEWPAIRHELAWQYFEGYVETPRLFVFLDCTQLLRIVPKAVLDELELNQFRETVQENLRELHEKPA
jgi:hypothetical protein